MGRLGLIFSFLGLSTVCFSFNVLLKDLATSKWDLFGFSQDGFR